MRILYEEGDALPGGFIGYIPLLLRDGSAQKMITELNRIGLPAIRSPYPSWHLDPFFADLAYRDGLIHSMEEYSRPAQQEPLADDCPHVKPFSARLFLVRMD